MKGKIGYLYIFLAGIFWSTLGFIVSNLNNLGFSSEEISFFRMVVGFIMITIYGKLFIPTMFKITKKGILYVIGVGVVCQFIFNFSYLGSICTVGASVAAVLLYTSPLFVAIFSRIFYKEKINNTKKLSLVFCIIGAFFAVTGGTLDLKSLNIVGILLGVCAGVTYAMLPIFGKKALEYMDNITMTAYSFLVAAVLMCSRVNPIHALSKVNNLNAVLFVLAIGLIPSVMAYVMYLKGISKGVELSIAGVIASVELVFSVIIGWTVLGEAFSITKLVGLLFMIISTFVALKAMDNVNDNDYTDINKVG